MNTYKVKFSVNGNNAETTINAYSQLSAMEIIKSQYTNTNLIIWSVTKIN